MTASTGRSCKRTKDMSRMLLWVNNFLSKFEGKKRDVPNIADYSIWYLQLPLKKKGEEEKEENIQPIQNELHVHSTIIQTWLQSKNAGASLIVMASSATLATSRETLPLEVFCSKKKKVLVLAAGFSCFVMIISTFALGPGRHGNNSSVRKKSQRS